MPDNIWPTQAYKDACARYEAERLRNRHVIGDRVIITNHDYPPIPIRTMDWSAHDEDCEESGPYGHGPTMQAAIDDLLDNYDAPETE